MGKRIIQQARGKGSFTYKVRKKAFIYKIAYPDLKTEKEGEIIKLIHSRAHTAPIAKIKVKNDKGEERTFYAPAFEKAFVGQKINIHGNKPKNGDITEVGKLEIGTKIFNIERNPNDGGKMMRAAGSSAIIFRKSGDHTIIRTPSKKEVKLNPRCRAQVGHAAGSGRQDKPVMKAGKKYHIKKTKSKLWPRTSAVKMNVVDHPFGSGRGKRITHGKKGKIAKRNAPAGARVGLIRPKRTGRKKR